MSWQDTIFTLGGLIFVAGLIPLAISKRTRIHRKAAFLTAATLASFVVAYVSLAMWGAALTTGATASLWAFLGWRRAGA